MQALPTAPIWRRFAALIYDSFILAAISFAYGVVITVVGANKQTEVVRDYQVYSDSIWVFICWLVVLAGFYALFWKRGGQTIGMKTWRLQLISSEQAPVTWRQIFLRLLSAPPLVLLFGLGYWTRWFDQKGDCLHDKLSSTHVVLLPKESKT